MHKGGCLRGSLRHEIIGEPGPILLCHCSRCRKMTGSAFAAAELVRPGTGALDTAVPAKPVGQVFVGPRSAWSRVHGDLSPHAERP